MSCFVVGPTTPSLIIGMLHSWWDIRICSRILILVVARSASDFNRLAVDARAGVVFSARDSSVRQDSCDQVVIASSFQHGRGTCSRSTFVSYCARPYYEHVRLLLPAEGGVPYRLLVRSAFIGDETWCCQMLSHVFVFMHPW